MTLIDLTSSPSDSEEDYLVDDTPKTDAPPTDTAPLTDRPFSDSQPYVTPDYRRGIGGWIEESDPEEETQPAYPRVSDDDDTTLVPDDMDDQRVVAPAKMPHETPPHLTEIHLSALSDFSPEVRVMCALLGRGCVSQLFLSTLLLSLSLLWSLTPRPPASRSYLLPLSQRSRLWRRLLSSPYRLGSV